VVRPGRSNLEPKIHKGSLSAKGFRFAIVESRWNELLTSKLTGGALDALERLGAEDGDVEVFKVPGSFELPLTAKRVALTGKFDAVICIGVVIRGETPHFDYVAGEAAKGIAQAAMATNVPVLFGVVTADTVEQALNRCGIKSGNKGFDAAMSAVEIVSLLKEVGGDEEAGGDATFPHAV
jgi:6,7-dimethyl-8-ribityllumazine synthase